MTRHIIALFALLVTSCATKPPTHHDATPPPPPPDEVQTPTEPAVTPPDGEELYGRVCITCHGPRGDGTGLEQELFSFGSPTDQWTNGPTVDGILTTLGEGVHDTSMQAFPEFGDVERRAIAAYVLELRADLVKDAAQ